MERNFKTYKQYYIYKKTLENTNKINQIKKIMKLNGKSNEADILVLENWYTAEVLTKKQWQLLKERNYKQLKELLKKQLIKEQKKLEEAKKEALKDYQKIEELKDIKSLLIEVEWSSGRRSMGAYQTKAIGHAFYKNGTSERVETGYTGGCGYDKPSTSASEVCNKLAKITMLKNWKKIQNSEEKHYKFYAGEYGYFQYGVGINCYETFFKNCGYNVKMIYHNNENITLIITSKRGSNNENK